MSDEYKQIDFFSLPIEVEFDTPPKMSKKPHCPDRFTWDGETYKITELLAEWSSYDPKGRLKNNKRPHKIPRVRQKGSWGVGRYHFRVRTDSGRIFDIYYDRAPKDALDRMGSWTIFSELEDA